MSGSSRVVSAGCKGVAVSEAQKVGISAELARISTQESLVPGILVNASYVARELNLPRRVAEKAIGRGRTGVDGFELAALATASSSSSSNEQGASAQVSNSGNCGNKAQANSIAR